MPPDWNVVREAEGKIHKIEKVDDDHWIVDYWIHIKYCDSFGFCGPGWYIEDRESDRAFPDTNENFLIVLEKALGYTKSKPKLMPRGV